VAMTGYGRDAVGRRARQVGIDDYLVESAQPGTVLALARMTRTAAPPG